MISALRIEFPHGRLAKEVETRVRQELAGLEKFYNRLVNLPCGSGSSRTRAPWQRVQSP